MKRFVLVLSLMVVVVIGVAVVAADKGNDKGKAQAAPKGSAVGSQEKDSDKEKAADRWMLAKLESSQQIFAGLTRGDLDTVKQRAQGMLLINFLESWLRDNEFTKKSAYQGQLNAFEFANKELIRNAGDGDIDGTLNAWQRLSRSCVECHKLIRDTKK